MTEAGATQLGTRILVVGGDHTLRQLLADHLRMHESFITIEAATAAEALGHCAAGSFDLCLVDVGLPDLDGRNLCRRIRRSGVAAPVILLTAGEPDADTVNGLDAGADDCIAKPFRLSVLVTRMRAQLRREARSDNSASSIGRYHFNPSDRQLLDRRAERRIRLTERETALLSFLLHAGPQPVKRKLLLARISHRI